MNENLGDDESGLEPDDSDWGINKIFEIKQDDAVEKNSAAKRTPRRPKGSRDDNPRKRSLIARKHVRRAALNVQNQATNHCYRKQITAPSMAISYANNTVPPYLPCGGRPAMTTGSAFLPLGMFPMDPKQQSPFFMSRPFFPPVTSNYFSPPPFSAHPNNPGERVVIFGNNNDVHVRTENNGNPEFILVDPLCGNIGFGSLQETRIVLEMQYNGDTIIGPIHSNSRELHFLVLAGVKRKVVRCHHLHGRYWLQKTNGENDAADTSTQPLMNNIIAAEPTPTPAMTPDAQQATEPVVLSSISLVSPPVPQNRDSQPTSAKNRMIDQHQHQQNRPNTMMVPCSWERLSQHTTTLGNEGLPSLPNVNASLAVVPQETSTPTVLEIPSPGVVLTKVGKDGREQIHVMNEQGDCHMPSHPLNGMIGFSSHKQALFAVQNYFSNFRVHATGTLESVSEVFELYKSPVRKCDGPGAFKTFRSVFRHGRFWLEDLASTSEPNRTSPHRPSIVYPPVPQTGQPTVNPSWTIQRALATVPALNPPHPSQPTWTCRAPNEYECNLLRAARRLVFHPLFSVNGRRGFASQDGAASALLRHWNGYSFIQSELPDLGGGSIEYLVLESENDNSTKSNCIFRIVKSSGRFWTEEVSFQNRLEQDFYRAVI
jgi:hypothetical protein